MRIGFISYEYVGVGSGGGIGTYCRHAAAMMAARGHDVEVFCGGESGAGPTEGSRTRVETIAGPRSAFSENVRKAFARRHTARPFDVIEGPEFGADAAGIRADQPHLPLVVRLHTPGAILGAINNSYVPLESKARFVAGALRRGRAPKCWWRNVDTQNDPERLHILDADRVAAPSLAIRDRLASAWQIPLEMCDVVPNVFEPGPPLLGLTPNPTSKTVLFLGKLEVRKGALELARAVPTVARAVPGVRFNMVGRDLPVPGTSGTVGGAMRRHYGSAKHCVTHTDAVAHREVPSLFAAASIAVFPSVWENLPYVCLEAMAAGRAVIGSSAGGMAEIIEHGRTGLLVPPRDPPAIAEAIISLLRDPEKALALAEAGRERVLTAYCSKVIAPLQEASYQRAIAHARAHNGHTAGTVS